MKYQINSHRVASSFGRAANTYDGVADLQRCVGQELLQRLKIINKKPKIILDVGSGTGWLTKLLSERFVQSKIFALDVAYPMLSYAKQHYFSGQQKLICADAKSLPLTEHSVDLIFSNLMFQWCVDLDQLFTELRRVLKPRGFLIFTTLGEKTLNELRNSWARVDDHNHVNYFIDKKKLEKGLQQAGFKEQKLEKKDFTQKYQELRDIVLALKNLGAHNITEGRPRGLCGKQRWQKLIAAYEKYRDQGLLPVSYEVFYGTAK